MRGPDRGPAAEHVVSDAGRRDTARRVILSRSAHGTSSRVGGSRGEEHIVQGVTRKGYVQQQAKRDRKPAVPPEQDRWSPPPASECDEETYHYFLDIDAKYRISQRQRTHDGQLVDYAVTLARLYPEGSWIEITCIDCCHGNVHRHDGPHYKSEPKIIRPIFSQLDVQQTFGAACDAVWDSYIEYVRDDFL